MTMTLSEILSTCNDWDKFCDEKGFSVWAVNEGGGHVEVNLTIDEAEQFGIIRNN
jgi:hypothetical protein